eukprot:Selendium_serpulae@DN6288_c0_g1_i1.p1
MTKDQKEAKVGEYLNELDQRIADIFKGGAGTLSFQRLYLITYYLITHLKRDTKTYETIAKAFEDEARYVKEELMDLASTQQATLLEKTLRRWKGFVSAVDRTSEVCDYMNKFFHPTHLSVGELGRHIFRRDVIGSVGRQLTSLLTQNVETSRDAKADEDREAGNNEMIKGITEMLVDISVPSSTISPTNMAGGVSATSDAAGHPLKRFARQEGRMGWKKEAYIRHFEEPFYNRKHEQETIGTSSF